jgi:hypothetical protein
MATPGLGTRSGTENLRFFVFRAGKGPTPQRANLLALRPADLPPMAGLAGAPEAGHKAPQDVVPSR